MTKKDCNYYCVKEIFFIIIPWGEKTPTKNQKWRSESQVVMSHLLAHFYLVKVEADGVYPFYLVRTTYPSLGPTGKICQFMNLWNLHQLSKFCVRHLQKSVISWEYVLYNLSRSQCLLPIIRKYISIYKLLPTQTKAYRINIIVFVQRTLS